MLGFPIRYLKGIGMSMFQLSSFDISIKWHRTVILTTTSIIIFRVLGPGLIDGSMLTQC